MPAPEELRLWVSDGMVSITRGSRLLFCFADDDAGMRNLVILALRDAGVAGVEVAELFGLTPRRVSGLRGEAKREGSAALVRPRGRPPKLTDRDVAKARRWKAEGVSGREIASRLGVSDATISRAVAGVAVAPSMIDADADAGIGAESVGSDGGVAGEDGDVEGVVVLGWPVTAPLEASVSCRYAGAMLVHAFLSMVGAGPVWGSGRSGRDRFSAVQVSLCAMFGLVLGAGSMESIKHLGRDDLGLLAGCGRAPELKTLRARLGVIADQSDALAMMASFTKAMLAGDPARDGVFYVDDHFVPYYGQRPVAKGWNTKRRHAMAGWDDTMICDRKGRIVAFTSAEPSGLSVTMDAALAQLSDSLGATDNPMIGFDRGGSYPVVFARLDTAGIEWITYRRGDTIDPTGPPKRTWCNIDGVRHSFLVADEIVALSKTYRGARQITLFDDGVPAVQILTSNHTITAAAVVTRMRARWGIENAFKSLTAHHGIDQLCDYRMDMIDDTREIDHPDRAALNTQIAGLRKEHQTITGQIGTIVTDRRTADDTTTERRRLRDERYMIADEIEALEELRRTIPAKTAANIATPGQQRAIPRIERRAYQMILRLLTYNALRWLAEQLDTYLTNPDEVHALTRALLHQPGTITYTPTEITVTITAPDTPTVARALNQLCDQLNHATTRARIPGDRRPITYQTQPRNGNPHTPSVPEV
jgi:hypothetical protein